MNYTKTIPSAAPAEPAQRPRFANGKSKAPTLADMEARDPALHKARVAFVFLLMFTTIVYARPSDIFWALQKIPLAMIMAILACLAYGVARLQGGMPFVWTTEVKIVFALTGLYIAGAPFAFWRTQALNTLTDNWMKTLIIFFLITQVVFTLGRVRKLIWTIIFCEFIVAAYSLAVPEARVTNEDRMRGATVGFLSGNYLGIAVATTLPYIAVLLVKSRSFVKSGILVATSAMVMWMVVLTASRGSLLCVLLSLVLVWVMVLRKSAKARMLGVVLGVAMVLALAFAPQVFWDRISTMWDKEGYATSDTALSAGESEYQRRALLQRSIDYTLQHPVFGVGLGNFPIVSGTLTGNSQEWKGTHNTFTQVSSEAGIPAFLLFVSLLLLVARNMGRASKACGDDPAKEELQMYTLATQVSIYAFMLAGFFAHLAYEAHLFYLTGIGVALQTVLQRSMGPAAALNGARGWRNGKRGLAQ